MRGKRRKTLSSGFKALKTRNKVLVAVLGFEVFFILVMLVFFAIFRSIPDTLCTCVLGAGGFAELVTGAITVAEILKKEN